jgi:hypothetical protein
VNPAGTRHGEFRTALRTRSYRLARNAARDLSHIGLQDALALTLLAAEKEPKDFEPMARRWQERFLAEGKPTLGLIPIVAADLRDVGDPHCPHFVKSEARARLRELQQKL